MTRTKLNIRRIIIAISIAAAVVIYSAVSRAPSQHPGSPRATSGTSVKYATAVAQAAEEPQTVRITASRFQFSPNRITLKKDRPVMLQLTSTDRTHGLLLRALHIDTDIRPGTTTQLALTPRVAGTFKAICDHYCGMGHGNMKMTVVVE